jgi:hypothetical protein
MEPAGGPVNHPRPETHPHDHAGLDILSACLVFVIYPPWSRLGGWQLPLAEKKNDFGFDSLRFLIYGLYRVLLSEGRV